MASGAQTYKSIPRRFARASQRSKQIAVDPYVVQKKRAKEKLERDKLENKKSIQSAKNFIALFFTVTLVIGAVWSWVTYNNFVRIDSIISQDLKTYTNGKFPPGVRCENRKITYSIRVIKVNCERVVWSIYDNAGEKVDFSIYPLNAHVTTWPSSKIHYWGIRNLSINGVNFDISQSENAQVNSVDRHWEDNNFDFTNISINRENNAEEFIFADSIKGQIVTNKDQEFSEDLSKPPLYNPFMPITFSKIHKSGKSLLTLQYASSLKEQETTKDLPWVLQSLVDDLYLNVSFLDVANYSSIQPNEFFSADSPLGIRSASVKFADGQTLSLQGIAFIDDGGELWADLNVKIGDSTKFMEYFRQMDGITRKYFSSIRGLAVATKDNEGSMNFRLNIRRGIPIVGDVSFQKLPSIPQRWGELIKRLWDFKPSSFKKN